MGKKKSTTTQTNKPIYSAEIGGAARNVQDAYGQSQPLIRDVSSNLGRVSADLFAQQRAGDPTIQAAQGFTRNLLEGGSNPYLDDMLDVSNERVRNQVQARLGRTGNAGGSDYTNLISRALAQNETGVRYNDFDRTRQAQLQAAGLAPTLLQGSYIPAQLAAQFGQQGALLPIQAAGANAGSIGGLLGQYQDVRGKTTQSGGLFESILGAGLQIGGNALAACDIRLKENIERVGSTPGGVPVYRFDYRGGLKGMIGPMAHEVAILQPEALGPEVDGYMTVNLGALQ